MNTKRIRKPLTTEQRSAKQLKDRARRAAKKNVLPLRAAPLVSGAVLEETPVVTLKDLANTEVGQANAKSWDKIPKKAQKVSTPNKKVTVKQAILGVFIYTESLTTAELVAELKHVNENSVREATTNLINAKILTVTKHGRQNILALNTQLDSPEAQRIHA